MSAQGPCVAVGTLVRLSTESDTGGVVVVCGLLE